MTVFGLFFLAGSVAFFWFSRIPSNWTKIQGTVYSATTSYDQHGVTYCPKIHYTVGAIIYSLTSSECGGSVPIVGARAQVAYNPMSPASAKAVPGFGEFFLIGLTGLVGLSLLISALVLRLRVSRPGTDTGNVAPPPDLPVPPPTVAPEPTPPSSPAEPPAEPPVGPDQTPPTGPPPAV
jgi:hypothetical protein